MRAGPLPLGQSQVRLVQAVQQHAHGRFVERRLNRIGRGAQCLRVDFASVSVGRSDKNEAARDKWISRLAFESAVFINKSVVLSD
jgi:hypothetical protein